MHLRERRVGSVNVAPDSALDSGSVCIREWTSRVCTRNYISPLTSVMPFHVLANWMGSNRNAYADFGALAGKRTHELGLHSLKLWLMEVECSWI